MKVRKDIWIHVSIAFILVFYVLRCIVMNLNILFSLVVLVEAAVVLILLLRFSFRRYQTKKNFIWSVVYIAVIGSVFLFLGHFLAIPTLYLSHHQVIEVFREHQDNLPIADKVNGAWILEEADFVISPEEREVLTGNYEKLSPCFYDRGYCYFQLGGFLKNSGGYCLKISSEENFVPGSFGFHRIDKMVKLMEDWSYYQ